MTTRKIKCPQTKEDFVNRILSYDFDGDIRKMGGEGTRIERAGPQSFFVYFPELDRKYELTVSIPRSEQPGYRAPILRAPPVQAKPSDPEPVKRRKRVKEDA